MTVRMLASVEVDAPPEVTWDLLVDAPRQGEWMLGTRVEGGRGVGAELKAWTGIGPIGFDDSMVVTLWEPPRRYMVEHTGKVVNGTGFFEIEPLPRGRSRLVWAEDFEPPLGVLGRAGWLVIGPVFRAGVDHSLAKFARIAAAAAGRAAA